MGVTTKSFREYFVDEKSYLRRGRLTRHHLGYFRTHDRLGRVRIRPPPPSPAISRINGRIEPNEAAFESSPRVLPEVCLIF